MTYLDPNQTQAGRMEIGKWALRVVAAAVICALGWYAFTVGTDSNGRPDIVSEPGDTQEADTPLTE